MSTQARESFQVRIPIDVRWGDMDAYGHVNNAKFFTYCESARIAYFDRVDLQSFGEPPGHGAAVVTATCNFRRQVHHPASLEVGARATKVGNTSFTLEYGIFVRETDELVADGSSVVVWVDYAVGKSQPLPEELKRRIVELDGLEAS